MSQEGAVEAPASNQQKAKVAPTSNQKPATETKGPIFIQRVMKEAPTIPERTITEPPQFKQNTVTDVTMENPRKSEDSNEEGTHDRKDETVLPPILAAPTTKGSEITTTSLPSQPSPYHEPRKRGFLSGVRSSIRMKLAAAAILVGLTGAGASHFTQPNENGDNNTQPKTELTTPSPTPNQDSNTKPAIYPYRSRADTNGDSWTVDPRTGQDVKITTPSETTPPDENTPTPPK